jgi:hypothetical protein
MMKNVSTGTGLVALSAAMLGSTALVRFGPSEGTAHAGGPAAPMAADAIAAVGAGQVTPTIVWYGNAYNQAANVLYVIRAWSDGRMEFKMGTPTCNANGVLWINPGCGSGCADCQDRWQVISDPAQGLTYRSDINFDADLTPLLSPQFTQ